MQSKTKTIKETLEEREYEILSPYATKCKESKGRKRERNEVFEVRTEFQRDRDKILHSKNYSTPSDVQINQNENWYPILCN